MWGHAKELLRVGGMLNWMRLHKYQGSVRLHPSAVSHLEW